MSRKVRTSDEVLPNNFVSGGWNYHGTYTKCPECRKFMQSNHKKLICNCGYERKLTSKELKG